MPDRVDITPDTPLWTVIEAYPAMADLIYAMIPTYATLRNSPLRETVGRSLSIGQAAASAGLSTPELVLSLRKACGLTEADATPTNVLPNAPLWVQKGTLSFELDAREMLASGLHPKELIVNEFSKLQSGQVMRLVTPFVPGPLIELGRGAGLETWTKQRESGKFETFFGKR